MCVCACVGMSLSDRDTYSWYPYCTTALLGIYIYISVILHRFVPWGWIARISHGGTPPSSSSSSGSISIAVGLFRKLGLFSGELFCTDYCFRIEQNSE